MAGSYPNQLGGTTQPIPIDSQRQGWNGKLYEQTVGGKLFCFGCVSTALNANNATATAVDATAKPVIGLYNPKDSGKNLVVLKTCINETSIAASTVLPGAFVWLYKDAQTITTGSTPIPRMLGGAAQASVAKAFAVGTALTGLSGNLVNTAVPATVASVNTAQPGTATSMFGAPWLEDHDGSWIVPPGSVLCIMNTVSTTTVSVASFIQWAELDVASGI